MPQSVHGAAAGELPVQMGYRVSPDTVLIGQPFNLFVKVHAPKGVRFEFPAGPDTATQNGIRPIELRGEKLVSMLADTAVALYHLVAWDVGAQPLRFPDVRVTFEGQERRPHARRRIGVREIGPACGYHAPGAEAGATADRSAGLQLAALARRCSRRRSPPCSSGGRGAVTGTGPRRRSIPTRARSRNSRGSSSSGFSRRAATASTTPHMVDVVREYLAARVPGVRRSDTSSELLRTMQPRDGVEGELPRLLERADW